MFIKNKYYSFYIEQELNEQSKYSLKSLCKKNAINYLKSGKTSKP